MVFYYVFLLLVVDRDRTPTWLQSLFLVWHTELPQAGKSEGNRFWKFLSLRLGSHGSWKVLENDRRSWKSVKSSKLCLERY